MTSSSPVPAAVEAESTVLVVDDVAQNLVAMQALLASPGVRVLTAGSGREALELLLAHDVAVALLDVHMPEMDGFELAELMRGSERTRGVPLIFLTAAAEDQQRLFRGYDAGAVDFLHKPIEPHVILSKVGVFVELQRQRHQLARRMEQLRQSLLVNEMFAAVLGHDLRSPLSAIRMSAEWLARSSADTKTQEAAERVRNSSARMARLIDQLLNYSRDRARGLQLTTRPADLGELGRLIAAEFASADGVMPVDIQTLGDLQGEFDLDRVSQILSNLLANAIEHKSGSGPVGLRLDGRDARLLRIEVSNSGTIPAELQGSLFDPFHGEDLERPGRGLGLGLYIVHQFAQAHGGTVHVATTEEGDTVVSVSLARHTGSRRALEPLAGNARPNLFG